MGEIKFVVGLMLLSLFTIAIIGYAINFGIDNNTAINLNQDAEFNKLNANIQGNLSTFRTETESGSQSLMKTPIESGGDNMETGQAFKVGIIPMVDTIRGIGQTIKVKIFGGSSALGIFVTAFFSLLVFLTGRYIWKTWKGGNPD